MVSIPVFYVYREQFFYALIALDKVAQAALSGALVSLLKYLMLGITLVLDPTIISQIQHATPEWAIRFNEEIKDLDLRSVSNSLGYYLLLSLRHVLPRLVTYLFGGIDTSSAETTPINIWDDPQGAWKQWMLTINIGEDPQGTVKQLMSTINFVADPWGAGKQAASTFCWGAFWYIFSSLGVFFVSSLMTAAPFISMCFYVFTIYKILATSSAKAVDKADLAMIVKIYLVTNETKNDAKNDAKSDTKSGVVIKAEPGSVTELQYTKKDGLNVLPDV